MSLGTRVNVNKSHKGQEGRSHTTSASSILTTCTHRRYSAGALQWPQEKICSPCPVAAQICTPTRGCYTIRPMHGGSAEPATYVANCRCACAGLADATSALRQASGSWNEMTRRAYSSSACDHAAVTEGQLGSAGYSSWRSRSPRHLTVVQGNTPRRA